jgi:ornithine cyclodeaminase/alanine dehydrogenase-like protein (mu-crystallin family)
MMAIFLTERDVRDLLTMEEALRAVEEAFRSWGEGRAISRPRLRVRVPKGFLHLMPAAALEEQVMGFKAYSTIVGNKSRFAVMLFSVETGEVRALIEANRLGQVRTGAASGVAAKYLAREDARTVGIIGTGYQAETQLEALCKVRSIERIKAYSRTQERRQAFAQRMAQLLGVDVQAVESAEEAVREADIVVTATTAREPVLRGEWLAPGTCVLAVGSNHWMRRELATDAIERADRIVVDDLEQAKVECGDLMAAVERGVLRWEQVRELKDVVVRRVSGRKSREEITLFESQGIALEDVAVAAHVVRLAEERRLGRELEFTQGQ